MKLLYYKMVSTEDSYEKKHHQRHSMSIEVRMNKGKWRNELAI